LTVRSLLIVCDGTSDICLQDIIQFVVDENFPDQFFRILSAKEVIPAHGPLKERLVRACQLYEPNLILCHRDAEGNSLDERTREIEEAAAGLTVFAVPLIPVRMLESWLLLDETAIRRAANNSNGRAPLDLPRSKSVEALNDPKTRLFDALRAASELGPNRLRNFNVHQARSRITGYFEQIQHLRDLQSFCRFEQRLIDAISSLN
jgi:hypothetical protein